MTAPARKSAAQTAPPRTPAKPTKSTKATGKTPTRTTGTKTGSTKTGSDKTTGTTTGATRTTGRTTGQADTAEPIVQPAERFTRAGAGRGRSAAAERAYARRAQRVERVMVGPRPDRRAGSAGRVTFVVLVIVLLIGGVVAVLWFATQATADAYALGQAKAQTAAMAQQVQRLRQDVAKADSAPSLAARARALGMVPAGDPAHLVVGPDGKVTVIGHPSSVTTTPPPPPANSAPPTTTGPPTSSPAGR